MAIYTSIYNYYLRLHHSCECNFKDCAKEPTHKLVHHFRLNIKKIRNFERLLDKMGVSEKKEHYRFPFKLKKVFKLAGQIRDTQVQINKLIALEEKTGIEYPEFRKWLSQQEKQAIQKFRQAAKNETPHAHPKEMQISDKIAAFTRNRTFLPKAEKELDNLYLIIVRLSKDCINDEDLHRIKKTIKLIRYSLNILQRGYPDYKYSKVSARVLSEMETKTGNWHDDLIGYEWIGDFIEKQRIKKNFNKEKYDNLTKKYYIQQEESYQTASASIKQMLAKQQQSSGNDR